MSLIDFIEKIQQKPRHVRVQILWLSVFISMLIIVSLWVTSFENQKASISGEIDQSLARAKKEIEIPSLKEALKDIFGVFFEEGLDQELEQLKIPAKSNQPENIILKETETIKPAKLPLSN